MSEPQENTSGDIGSLPRCQRCGSDQVVVDAWASWNPATGRWELEQTFDQAYCHVCEEQTALEWSRVDGPPCPAGRDARNAFQFTRDGRGSVILSRGLRDRDVAFVQRVIETVQKHVDFDPDEDPHGDEDFGAVLVETEVIQWKLIYRVGSAESAQHEPKHRLLIIMLDSEV